MLLVLVYLGGLVGAVRRIAPDGGRFGEGFGEGFEVVAGVERLSEPKGQIGLGDADVTARFGEKVVQPLELDFGGGGGGDGIDLPPPPFEFDGRNPDA